MRSVLCTIVFVESLLTVSATKDSDSHDAQKRRWPFCRGTFPGFPTICILTIDSCLSYSHLRQNSRRPAWPSHLHDICLILSSSPHFTKTSPVPVLLHHTKNTGIPSLCTPGPPRRPSIPSCILYALNSRYPIGRRSGYRR